MRTLRTGAICALALAGACSRRDTPSATLPDDLQTDLAAAAAASSAPRMRFVSSIEQVHAMSPAPSHQMTKHTVRSARRHAMTTGEAVETASGAAVSNTENVAPEVLAPSSVTTAEAPAAEPVPVPLADQGPAQVSSGGSEARGGERASGGGLGGFLGGLIGSVVIRGGSAGRDHCDPRTDGRGGGTIGGRPDFGMPLPTGGVFGGSGGGRRY